MPKKLGSEAACDRAVEMRVQAMVMKQGFDGSGVICSVEMEDPERYRFEVTYPKELKLWLYWDEESDSAVVTAIQPGGR